MLNCLGLFKCSLSLSAERLPLTGADIDVVNGYLASVGLHPVNQTESIEPPAPVVVAVCPRRKAVKRPWRQRRSTKPRKRRSVREDIVDC